MDVFRFVVYTAGGVEIFSARRPGWSLGVRQDRLVLVSERDSFMELEDRIGRENSGLEGQKPESGRLMCLFK